MSFLASFLDRPFLSMLGALSPIGVDAPEPGISTESGLTNDPPSPRMASALRFARFAALASSYEASLSTRRRHLSERDVVVD